MHKFASCEIDMHDNVSLLADLENIPDFVKKAHIARVEDTPNDKFAVVLVTEKRAFPKYSLGNKAAVWISSQLFCKTGSLLPTRGQQIAAYFIKRACDEYRMDCPQEVGDLADGVEKFATNVLDMSDYKDETALDYDKFRIGWKGIMPKEHLRAKLEEFATRNQENLVSSEEMGEELASRIYSYAMNEGFSLPEAGSLANVASSALPKGADKGEVKTFFENRIKQLESAEKIKRASLSVKIAAHQEDAFGVVIKTASGETIGHFPMNTPDMVKQAQEYWWDHYESLAPRYRRELACGIVKNASRHGLYLDDSRLVAYTGEDYALGLEGNILARKSELHEDQIKEGARTLDNLLTMHQDIKPEKCAEILEEFDKRAGLDRAWGKTIKDPYLTVFETGAIKTANWTYRIGGDVIDEEQLRRFMLNHAEELDGYINHHIISELKLYPVEIFDSLPLPAKEVILAKMQEAGVA